jgi:hypothetical protein
VSILRTPNIERELLSARLSRLIGRRPSSSSDVERERGVERNAQLDRIARRARRRS